MKTQVERVKWLSAGTNHNERANGMRFFHNHWLGLERIGMSANRSDNNCVKIVRK